jgi:hypothetical protein
LFIKGARKKQFDAVHFLPLCLIQDVLAEAHGGPLAGHDGIYTTKECLERSGWRRRETKKQYD